MITTTTTINNFLGLHARASAKFVALAGRYSSELEVTKGSQTVNGKSIMGVMMLSATKGTPITLKATGDDEDALMKAMLELIANKFGEAE